MEMVHFSSATDAYRAQRVLQKALRQVTVVPSMKRRNGRGCGYAVRFVGDRAQALALLHKANILPNDPR